MPEPRCCCTRSIINTSLRERSMIYWKKSIGKERKRSVYLCPRSRQADFSSRKIPVAQNFKPPTDPSSSPEVVPASPPPISPIAQVPATFMQPFNFNPMHQIGFLPQQQFPGRGSPMGGFPYGMHPQTQMQFMNQSWTPPPSQPSPQPHSQPQSPQRSRNRHRDRDRR